MDLDDINGFTLHGLSKINVLLGKNGCGKSHLLKNLEMGLNGRPNVGRVRYISPERGGLLQYDANVEQTIVNNPNWLPDQRRKNQSENFRQQSTVLFRRLELVYLREIEREHTQAGYVPRNFDTVLEQLNVLLDRVRVQRDNDKTFKIVERDTGNDAAPQSISSGEAELISLGIEFLAFARETVPDKENILLVDEPDVHLHPDLQYRLAQFIAQALKDKAMVLLMATHSTSLLAGLADQSDIHVAFMRRGAGVLKFKAVSAVDRAILPIFGAHPLSNVFNESPVLLIEGEDDERVWQQAVRSSQGRIRFHPCDVGGTGGFAEFEEEVNSVIEAVYDNARAFSLRDRDAKPEEDIPDKGHIVRMRLSCRSAENLMLSNECLAVAGTDWPTFSQALGAWRETNVSHQYCDEVAAFIEGGFNRKEHSLKRIRNICIGLITDRPWEVLVGQAIAGLTGDSPQGQGSLRDFLGAKVCRELLKF